jgi:TctA family transporter
VIGFVLSPIAEKKLGAGLQASSGSWLPLVSEPFSLVCCLLALVMLLLPFWRQMRAKKRRE